MPGASGLKLVEQLHALSPTMRIVVLTGYASIATAVEAVKLGAIGYLSKPATADEIAAALKRARGDSSVEPRAGPRRSNGPSGNTSSECCSNTAETSPRPRAR